MDQSRRGLTLGFWPLRGVLTCPSAAALPSWYTALLASSIACKGHASASANKLVALLLPASCSMEGQNEHDDLHTRFRLLQIDALPTLIPKADSPARLVHSHQRGLCHCVPCPEAGWKLCQSTLAACGCSGALGSRQA